MEKLKFYVSNESELNEEEKRSGKISYSRLIKYLFSDMILCNNITKTFYNNINGEYIEPFTEIGTDYDEESEDYVDIYQYYIVDYYSSCSYDFAKKYCNNEIIVYYIESLDLNILGVTHFGTGWDYVLTDFDYTTNYEESMQNNLYKEI